MGPTKTCVVETVHAVWTQTEAPDPSRYADPGTPSKVYPLNAVAKREKQRTTDPRPEPAR